MHVYILTFAGEGVKSGDDDTNKILKEMHNMLHHLIKRVEGTEKELKSMKVRFSTPSSDSSSSSKKTVPLVVKVSNNIHVTMYHPWFMGSKLSARFCLSYLKAYCYLLPGLWKVLSVCT